MESDLAAVEALKSSALVKLQEMADRRREEHPGSPGAGLGHIQPSDPEAGRTWTTALEQLRDALPEVHRRRRGDHSGVTMLSPRQIFEDNIRPAELLLRVYRLLEHDTPNTEERTSFMGYVHW